MLFIWFIALLDDMLTGIVVHVVNVNFIDVNFTLVGVTAVQLFENLSLCSLRKFRLSRHGRIEQVEANFDQLPSSKTSFGRIRDHGYLKIVIVLEACLHFVSS